MKVPPCKDQKNTGVCVYVCVGVGAFKLALRASVS